VRVSLKSLLLTVLGIAIGLGVAGAVVLHMGLYNVAATHQHLSPTYSVLQLALRGSINITRAPLKYPTSMIPLSRVGG
jgi:hypothetical protein